MIVNILFLIFSLMTLGSALLVITRRNPINAGVSLLMTFVSLAAIYILLNAQFIAIIQITIYAGAILVLVLFVIMLLNLRDPGRTITDLLFNTRQGVASLVFFAMLVVELVTVFILRYRPSTASVGTYNNQVIAETGAIQSLSEVLFTKFLLPFEVASVLLLVAIIGAVVLTKKGRDDDVENEKGGAK